ncbi:hypothetical protein ACFYV7_01805 [Nocardia suismassiliense]|uniref:ESX-1 secretion-associated protein EspA/EspE-like domain-containing protein n=1 Tax=Nocardia suismassiliense TaxID=2077092 RepID=A0ABW6QJW9_9NOCA
MSFDISQYNSVLDGLDKFFTKVDNAIKVDVPNAKSEALDLPYVRLLPPLQRLVKTCADKIIEPYEMYLRSKDWADVRDVSAGVKQGIDPNNVEALRRWEGSARTAYMQTCTSQVGAAGTFSDIADKARSAMLDAAVGGLAFYVGILVICAEFLLGLARAIAELITGVGAPVSIADIAATSGISTAAIWGACTALATFLGAQVKAMSDLERPFPEGKWPDSQSSSFNDASVDGDNKSNWKIL